MRDLPKGVRSAAAAASADTTPTATTGAPPTADSDRQVPDMVDLSRSTTLQPSPFGGPGSGGSGEVARSKL